MFLMNKLVRNFIHIQLANHVPMSVCSVKEKIEERRQLVQLPCSLFSFLLCNVNSKITPRFSMKKRLMFLRFIFNLDL